MALAAATKAKRDREPQFFDVGVKGRKTGVTLKEGARDEHGIEAIDGIFSPLRSPERTNGLSHNATISTEEDMEVGQSTIPEPADMLKGRDVVGSRVPLPPARARSPVKTSLGSPPRRPLSAAPSSPHRLERDSPINDVSDSSVTRKLDFTGARSESQAANESLPPEAHVAEQPLDVPQATSSLRELKPGLDQEPNVAGTAVYTKKPPSASGVSDQNVDSHNNGNPTTKPGEDSLQLMVENEKVSSIEEKRQPSLVNPEITTAAVKRGRGRPRTSGPDANSRGGVTLEKRPKARTKPSSLVPSPSVDPDSAAKRGRGRPPKRTLASMLIPEPDSAENSSRYRSATQQQDSSPIGERDSSKKKRGRPAKQQLDESLVEIPDVEPRTKGRPRQPRMAKTLQDPVSSATKRKRGGTPKEFGQDAPGASSTTTTKVRGRPPKRRPEEASSSLIDSVVGPSKRPARPVTAQRMVADEAAITGVVPHRQSPGRPRKHAATGEAFQDTVLKPQSRRNPPQASEISPSSKRKRGRPNKDAAGTLSEPAAPVTTTTADEADNGELPAKKRRGRPKGVKNTKPRAKARHRSDDDEPREEWESRNGFLQGYVKQWDCQDGDGETGLTSTDIAYASSVILTREVANSTFRYAKTVTLPFFGSGIVDLPPGGYKKTKNSRKMQMVFFVHAGRVKVEVADTKFGIATGGMWQVPRGNVYSIFNESDHDARIFFAQGCEVTNEQIAEEK
ncbi:MAG: hypothetical protein M1817_004489 [Caeruleum heppii]|nr:MAG: hypothetical protein M1817_004489 [Caeruleum heppii]